MKIYDDYKDVHVRATVVFANAGVAYTDAAHTTAFTTEALKDIFFKGAIIDVNGVYHKPVSFNVGDDGVGVMTFVQAGAEDAPALVTIKAVNPVEE